MADNLTDAAEALAINFLFTNATATRPTMPIKVALVTANGTDSAAGTEVTGGSYARQSTTFTAASGNGVIGDNTAVTFTNMPAATIVGIELYDSAGTPVRIAYGALTASKTTNAGDTFSIATGDIDISIA